MPPPNPPGGAGNNPILQPLNAQIGQIGALLGQFTGHVNAMRAAATQAGGGPGGVPPARMIDLVGNAVHQSVATAYSRPESKGFINGLADFSVLLKTITSSGSAFAQLAKHHAGLAAGAAAITLPAMVPGLVALAEAIGRGRAESRNAENRQHEPFSPMLMGGYLQQQVADFQRSVAVAHQNQESALSLTRAVTSMRDAWTDFDAWKGRQEDMLGRVGAGFSGQWGAQLSSWARQMSESLGVQQGHQASAEDVGAEAAKFLRNPLRYLIRQQAGDNEDALKTVREGIENSPFLNLLGGKDLAKWMGQELTGKFPDPKQERPKLSRAGDVQAWLGFAYEGAGYGGPMIRSINPWFSRGDPVARERQRRLASRRPPP